MSGPCCGESGVACLAHKSDQAPVRLAIVGLPNAGKSVFFNHLVGSGYSVVANYSQTTVEPIYQQATLGQHTLEIIDTPGITSLDAESLDELGVIRILVEKQPDRILFCGDATRLKWSLLLLVQLLELDIPTIFCLNKADDAARQGTAVDIRQLSNGSGLRVLETSALHGIGLEPLADAVLSAANRWEAIRYPAVLEEALKRLQQLFAIEQMPSRGLGLLFIQGNPMVAQQFLTLLGPERLAMAQQVVDTLHVSHFPHRINQMIFQTREAWANRITSQASHQATLTVPGLSHWLGSICRHPIMGWPVFLAILWLTFAGVGHVAAEVSGLLDEWIFAPTTGWIGESIPWPLLHELLVGKFGLLTMGLFNAFLTVVPILIVFFLIINFLEDVGYLPNLSVLANRTLTPFGLSGKAVLPLVLGTGCNTMATMSTRMLATRRERLTVSFLVALGVPCSVQLGVILAIMATAPFSVLLIVMTSVIMTSLITGMILKRMIPASDGQAEFLLELPQFRWPHWRNILHKTYHRLRWFLVEAVPLFMAAALMMFILETTGALVAIKNFLHPIVTGLLDLPDKVTEVFILVLSRREVGAVYFKDMVDGGELDYYQMVTGLVVITLFIPCASNTIVMIKELGARWAIAMNVTIISIALVVGGIVNFLIRLI
ncbi:MAG: ferrous iron transporter B [Magnetococcales bacterium]|nr:ferrous iron transporter B [Magnetococcales bacterium]